MKKGLIYGGVAGVMVLCMSGVALTLGASAETVDTSEPLGTIAANLISAKTLNISKDETVYTIADASGAATKVFVGNTLYNGSAELPYTMSVKYYLDGAEIKPSDLAGASGHVKMVFSYDSVAYYQGKKVPFLAVSGMMLDTEKFSNIDVTSGKVIDDGSRVTVVGYALPGVNDDLGVDVLPDEFTVEADVTGFELPVTYTLLTNEIFAEIDTSRLTDLDAVVSAVNDLSAGLSQIISGAGDLSNGLETLVSKSGELKTGALQLRDGLAELATNNDALNAGAEMTFNSLLLTVGTQVSAAVDANATLKAALANYYGITTPLQLEIGSYETTLGAIIGVVKNAGGDASAIESALTSLQTYHKFYSGLSDYTAGVAQAAAGAENLAAGVAAVIDGETQLYNGAVTLVDGLNTFKTTGIDKLVSVANNDIEKFVRNARATVTAAQSYRRFDSENATNVKFIVKTAGIK